MTFIHYVIACDICGVRMAVTGRDERNCPDCQLAQKENAVTE